MMVGSGNLVIHETRCARQRVERFMPQYDIVFEGRITPGASPEAVQARLAALFKTDAKAIARLFSGRRYVIKKGLDTETARKYQHVLEKAGAVCELVEKREPSGMTIAPPGSLLAEPPQVGSPDIDIGNLSMAAPGEDILEDYTCPAPPPLDISAMSVAPPGETIEALAGPPPPPPPAPGKFDIAEPGTLLVEHPPTMPGPVPESGHLDLVPLNEGADTKSGD